MGVGAIPETAAGRLRELHISRAARARYGFPAALFASSGAAILADLDAARQLAERMLAVQGEAAQGVVSPGAINALGLIDELLHAVFRRFRAAFGDHLLRDLARELEAALGAAKLDSLLLAFLEEFPPQPVFQGESTEAEYLVTETAGEPHREQLLEELVVLWLANENPAFAPYRELFDDQSLRARAPYEEVLTALGSALARARLEPAGPDLLTLLRRAREQAPESLEGQIRVLLAADEVVAPRAQDAAAVEVPRYWEPAPAEATRLLRGLDVLAEERPRPGGAWAPGPVELPPVVVDPDAEEARQPQHFTPDQGWMPRLVLVAKNTLVWLAQLAAQHGRTISRLDEIPDSELDELARRGFTGLWLIGVWERSTASRQIKHLCGQADAESSAYALADYRIAAELGGEDALGDLERRAARRGIRLASDMVPNHTGIDARWVIEHPERFIQTASPPYPVYTFEGPDLSSDPRVGIFLEDHYYRRTDAAVVFKRLERATGEVRYLYHGNDGTQTAWNDTAQLDYLQATVRAAVIDEILQVARLFPIVRFDAAMTLAKRHHHRLWYPAPGTGGDIPSRAEAGLSDAEFDALMPNEFWREAVDRLAVERPDVLLLAEAFWLMETYFVRTLGLHRVYNSAFMHTLRTEDNAKLRQIVTRLLRFDREILRRYVNFLSNLDEVPTAGQFGTGDKYAAAATLLATMPGLPMFSHGQVEGLTEKYGMEFSRPRQNEAADAELVARHRREIAPLLAQRRLFAGVEDCLVFDVQALDGGQGEDLLALANRHLATHSLVLVHNRHGALRGWVSTAADHRAPHEPVGPETLPRVDLASALGLDRLEPGAVAILTDPLSRRDFVVPVRQLAGQGLYVEMGAYERRVFLGAQMLTDTRDRPLLTLAAELRGQGCINLWSRLAPPGERSAVEHLQAVLDPGHLAPLLRPEHQGLEDGAVGQASARYAAAAAGGWAAETRLAADQRDALAGELAAAVEGLVAARVRLRVASGLAPVGEPLAVAVSDGERRLRALAGSASAPAVGLAVLAGLAVAPAGVPTPITLERWRERFADWLFTGVGERAGALLWLDVENRRRALRVLRADLAAADLAVIASACEPLALRAHRLASAVMAAGAPVAAALGVNGEGERLWLRQEGLADVLLAILARAVRGDSAGERRGRRRALHTALRLLAAAEAAEWQVAAWQAALAPPVPSPSPP
jgi:glycosidase